MNQILPKPTIPLLLGTVFSLFAFKNVYQKSSFDPEVQRDIQILKSHSFVVSNPHLAIAIRDALRDIKLVTSLNREDTRQGGSTICKYDAEIGLPKNYLIGYSKNSAGTLLHELVHVSVNQKFLQDFVNYKSPIAQNPHIPQYTSDGVRLNENLRQTKWMDQTENAKRTLQMQQIASLADACTKLKPEVKAYIKDKCSYASINPHIEYSTTVVQLAYYMFLQGFPVKNAPVNTPENNLYVEIDKALIEDLKARNVISTSCSL
ncbi:hypothetical protein [Flavobacterium oreochromis]|uniref:Uncharacterized protein n=2 Tax=Flavobacterium TaxID=237 RepID=A0A246GBR9_9FLAO|nr:hypothetical protein [Flavobacterium oreochromis]OWP76358.1 hypothetical protein BWG23_08335 [Flavobacterium oreochromis]OWP76464.1 hypothetical protein BWK62_09740 [Flavobacterium oreochromis]POR22079.1 hypothetical protein BWK58_11480 [Flavobacterium columnare]QYS86685.1 hypothetical protein JJC03_01060 [Flavobacterium oreochromis]